MLNDLKIISGIIMICTEFKSFRSYHLSCHIFFLIISMITHVNFFYIYLSFSYHKNNTYMTEFYKFSFIYPNIIMLRLLNYK